jgi:hypothetical protein
VIWIVIEGRDVQGPQRLANDCGKGEVSLCCGVCE